MSASTETGGGRPQHPVLRLTRYALAVAAVVFVGLALARSWQDVQAYEWSFRPAWLVVSGLVLIVFYVLQAVAWWLLLRAFDLRPPLVWAAASWARSILARYVPGNVFMFLGRALSSQRRGLPLRTVSAAMVYEQAIAFCAALATLGLLFPFWDGYSRPMMLSLLGIPLLLGLLHPRVFVPLADRALRLMGREPLDGGLGFGKVVAMLCYYVASWFVAGLGAWSLACAVTETGADALPAVTLAFVFAYVVGMVAFVFPGGIGVREAVLAGALANELGAGVALAWAVLLRLWQIAVELAFAGIVTVLERRRGGPADERLDGGED